MRTALCIFLFACSATSVLASVSSVIVDTDNDPVRNSGGAYYLFPAEADKESYSALGLAAVGSDDFPRTVVYETNLTNIFPVTISARERILIIKSSFMLGIKFLLRPGGKPARWIVQPEFPIGSAVKVEKSEIRDVSFRILPAKNGYKIVYYRKIGGAGAALGLVHSGGYYRLVVNDKNPFIFKIRKANEKENSARIMSVV